MEKEKQEELKEILKLLQSMKLSEDDIKKYKKRVSELEGLIDEYGGK